LIPQLLRPPAMLVQGFPRGGDDIMYGIGKQFSAVFLVGYHAAAGTLGSSMDHTLYPTCIYEARLNGHAIGEVTLCAAIAGHYGVPVVFVSGDQAIEQETRTIGDDVVFVGTKRGVERNAAVFSPWEEVKLQLLDGAEKAVSGASSRPPYELDSPVSLEVDLVTTSMADMCTLVPSVKRVSGRTVSFESSDFLDVYRMLMAIVFLAKAALAAR